MLRQARVDAERNKEQLISRRSVVWCAYNAPIRWHFHLQLTRLNELDADAIGGGDIAQDHSGFEFPWLHRHTDAFSFQFRAKRTQVPAISEAEVIGPPLIVT